VDLVEHDPRKLAERRRLGSAALDAPSDEASPLKEYACQDFLCHFFTSSGCGGGSDVWVSSGYCTTGWSCSSFNPNCFNWRVT